MLKIDERFNIEKSVVDCQMMCLDLFNVNIEDVKNVIIKVYDENYQENIDKYRMYEECGTVKVFFLIQDNIPKGEYKYNIELALNEVCKKNVLYERGFIVYD